MAAELAVRQLAALDIPTLTALERIGAAALGESALDAWMLPVVARCGLLFVGESAGEVVGAAELLRCADAGALYLEGLYISPEHQGRGLGGRLLAVVVDELARQGFTRVTATVAPDNDAGRRLYAAAGFGETAELPDYYGPGRHRLEIALDLSGRRA